MNTLNSNLKASMFVIGLCLAVTLLVYIAANKSFLGIEENGCDMTYMFEYPKYIKVNLKKKLSKNFPRYGLYVYGEGDYADELRRSKPTGIPVLFIPGNAGSHRQVRSLASVALRKAETKTNHFNYFTVDFDEDLGGLFGGVLMEQANFVHSCLRHILRMYKGNKNAPESVVIIGHSMGGLIARALYTLEGFQSRLVHLIITLGTPHVAPVIPLDTQLTSFYSQVNNFWHSNPTINNVTIISFAGGSRDILVPVKLCSLHHVSFTDLHFSAVSTALPDVWLTIDHLALCWCKQLIMVINRALFDMIDKKTNQITTTGSFQRRVLQQYFGYHNGRNDFSKETPHDKNQKIPSAIINNPTVLDADQQYEMSINGKTLVPTTTPKNDIHFMALTSDINNVLIKSCTKVQNGTCVGSTVSLLTTLPTSHGTAEFLHLYSHTLAKCSHIVVSTLKHKSHLALQFASETNINKMFSNFIMFAGSQTFLSANNILTNISLPMVRNCFDVFLITVKKMNCESGNKGLFTGRVHFPWFSQDIYASPSQSNKFDILLKVHISKPITVSGSAQLHIWDLDKCSHEVVIQHQFAHTLGHIFKMYGPYIPQWIYFWIIVILTIQIAGLSDEGIWLSIWSTVISQKLLKLLPLFVLVASEAITKLLVTFLGEYYLNSQSHLLVNSLLPYDWLLPSSFIILTAFVAVLFLHFILGLIVSFLARLFCLFSSKPAKPQSESDSTCSYLVFYSLFGSSLFCLSFLCSSNALYLLTIVTFVYSCKKTKECKELLLLEKSTSPTQYAVYNQLNLSKTLLVLLVVLSFQTSPAFIVWLKVLPTSWCLPSDPFFTIIIILTPTVICLLHMDLKRPPKHTSWVILSLCCAGFVLCSLDKLPYIVACILLVMDCFVFCKHKEHVKTF